MLMWPKLFGAHCLENERAKTLRHSGVRLGEIIGYRGWAVEKRWTGRSDDRLRSVFVRQYVWEPHNPATGDVQVHGIYSFRDPGRARLAYPALDGADVIFGSIKIWGEIVEHELGYRAEFAKIISLDQGNRTLLTKFRTIYGLC